MSTSKTPIVLIVGASRGLGLALAAEYLRRGWRVIATVRAARLGALHALLDESQGRLDIETVDINEAAQVAALQRRLQGQRLDLLFVNAGIGPNPYLPITEISTDEFVQVMINNALSPIRFIEAFHGMVRETGTIAVMSSRLGSVAENTFGTWEAYRASKAALNTLLRSYVARHASDKRTYLLMAPGWVRTDMGGPEADLSIEESIPRVIDTVSARTGQGGLRFVDYKGSTVSW